MEKVREDPEQKSKTNKTKQQQKKKNDSQTHETANEPMAEPTFHSQFARGQ